MKYLTSFFFLPSHFWSRSLAILFILFLFSFWEVFWGVSFVILVTLFLFRKNPKREQDSLKKGIFYSPINGKIARIKKNEELEPGSVFKEIKIKTHLFDGYGLYLPMTSEVSKVVYDEKKKKALSYFFNTKEGVDFGLTFKKKLLGLYPISTLLAGDRGVRQAIIGLFPLGGTTYFYIPESSELFVREGEKVIAGESLIASLDKELS